MQYEPFCSEFSLRFALELDPVCNMSKTIEEGISHCGVRDSQMPIGHGHLGGNQGRKAQQATPLHYQRIKHTTPLH